MTVSRGTRGRKWELGWKRQAAKQASGKKKTGPRGWDQYGAAERGARRVEAVPETSSKNTAHSGASVPKVKRLA